MKMAACGKGHMGCKGTVFVTENDLDAGGTYVNAGKIIHCCFLFFTLIDSIKASTLVESWP